MMGRLTFLLLILTSLLFANPGSIYQVVRETNREVVLEFHFPDVQSEALSENPHLRRFTIKGMSETYVPGQPLLPVLSVPLAVADQPYRVQVEVLESESFPGQFPAVFVDQPFGLTGDDARLRQAQKLGAQPFRGIFPQEGFVRYREAGLFRDYRILALQVFPVRVTGNGVTFAQKLRVTLRYRQSLPPGVQVERSEQDLVCSLVANKQQARRILPVRRNIGRSNPRNRFGEGFNPNRVRIVVKEEGIYRITGEDLEEAGVDLSLVNPTTLRLTNKGKEVAIWVVGDRDSTLDLEDAIEFWGEPNRKTFFDQNPELYSDPFSDENVYWLEWEGAPGLRMVEESGNLVTSDPTQFNPAPFFRETRVFEKNAHFERFGFAEVDKLSHKLDLWYFDTGVSAVGKKAYPFELVFPDSFSPNPVEVTALFRGKSSRSIRHDVMVWLNDNLVGRTRDGLCSQPGVWCGQDSGRVSNVGVSTIQNLSLRHGTNILEVQLPTKPLVGTDIALLNWFSVSYDRKYRAFHDQIKFRMPSVVFRPEINLFQFEVDGFTDPNIHVYKKGVSKIVGFNLDFGGDPDQQIFKITFQDNVLSPDVEYMAVTEGQKKKPLRIELDESFDPERPDLTLKDPSNSADYLIITHRSFYTTALRYRDYRRSQGLHVELVSTQDIYDEFNFGIKSPLAIKKFIQYVYQNWDPAHRLKYVLLLGDANLNYKTTSTTQGDFVPTFFYQTFKFGAAPTDLPYALVSGADPLPDLAIGRLPVQTNSDIQVALEKLQEYEQTPPRDPWRNQGLFISGNDAGTFEDGKRSKPLFRVQNGRVLNYELPRSVSAFRLNTIKNPRLDFDPNFGGTVDLIEHFDDGLFYVNFMGHGGGAIWADVNLFNLSDVDRLNNKGRYPFVTSMTCFTGAFENPGNPGLAHRLVLARDKGAIGVLASSGLGWAYNDFAVLWAVNQFLFQPSMHVGDAINLGKIRYFITREYYVNDTLRTVPSPSLTDEMIHQYNLIGDPYLQLTMPDDTLSLTVDNPNPQPGDTIRVNLMVPFENGEGYIEMADRLNQVVSRIPLFASGSSITMPLAIPADFPEGTGVVRAYLSDGTQDASGFVNLGINFATLAGVTTIPESPTALDSVFIRIQASDAEGIRKVFLFKQNVWDTIFTKEVAPGVYQTATPFPPLNKLGRVYYSIYIENNRGNTSIFRNRYYQVSDSRPDLVLFSGSLHFTGDETVQLSLTAGNQGGSAVSQALIHFYQDTSNYNHRTPFATATVDLQPGDSVAVQVDFPLPLTETSYLIYAEIDPLQQVSDFNRQNNVIFTRLFPELFNVTPELGSTLTGTQSDTIRLSVGSVYFPPGSITARSAVRVRVKGVDAPRQQKGLTPVPLLSPDQNHAIDVQLQNAQANIIQPFMVSLQLNPSLLQSRNIDIQQVKLYRKTRESRAWLFTGAQLDLAEYTLRAFVSEPGQFAPFLSSDDAAPKIELTVDGRPIKQSAQVSSKPTMFVVVEDESGLDIRRDQIQLFIDGQLVPEDKLFIPDSVQSSDVLGIRVTPELDKGSHSMEVRVRDVNGNVSRKTYNLLVSDVFDVHVFGAYPNPFRDQTIFSYFVSPDVLDEFEIRIYTISGRLIRRITEDVNTINQPFGARASGYNELIWDGLDENGVEVANGVYFALIRARYQDQVKEQIIKVAKLK